MAGVPCLGRTPAPATMPVHKTPEADLRRRYPLYAEAGLALALAAAVLAFTIPAPPSQARALAGERAVPLELVDVPLTDQVAPPPPPPPAPPPPVEVEDTVEIEDAVVEAVDLDLAELAPPPPSPPARERPAPTPPVVVPSVTPPPPPPVEVAPDEDEVFVWAQVQPALVGGVAALQALAEYPEAARRTGIEGTVVVQFVVDERGAVVDPAVVRSPHPLLSDAALEAVGKATFTPGQQRGRPVKVRFAVPVTFRLR